MKRGLKATCVDGDAERLCYNRCPDEKGTERQVERCQSACNIGLVSYNRFPDEKGTESQATELQTEMVTTVTPMTERKDYDVGETGPDYDEVTTVSPMKRGLKGLPTVGSSSILMLQPLPR